MAYSPEEEFPELRIIENVRSAVSITRLTKKLESVVYLGLQIILIYLITVLGPKFLYEFPCFNPASDIGDRKARKLIPQTPSDRQV